MRLLICGGAGYVGSHMVHLLREHDYDVVVFDNLSTGHRDAVQSETLVVGDIMDASAIEGVFRDHGPFDAVMHFCAKSLVGESVSRPALYSAGPPCPTHRTSRSTRQLPSKQARTWRQP